MFMVFLAVKFTESDVKYTRDIYIYISAYQDVYNIMIYIYRTVYINITGVQG